MEQVNNIEFGKDTTRSAKVSVKVGNVVGKVSFYWTWEDTVDVKLSPELATLRDGGVDIDTSELEQKFIELREQKAQELLEEARKEAGEKWKNSWVHNVDHIDGVEYEIEDREDYVDNVASEHGVKGRHPRFYVLYRDYKISITKEDVSSWRSHGKNVKYSISHKLTSHNKRNYAKPENAIKKIVKLADEKKEQEQRVKEQRQKAAQQRQEKKQRLQDEFGTIEIKKEYIHSRYGSGRYTHNFYIVKGENKYSIDEMHREEGLYRFEGFKNLNAEQVNQMVEILEARVSN